MPNERQIDLLEELAVYEVYEENKSSFVSMPGKSKTVR
jgi:hypothetical protein